MLIVGIDPGKTGAIAVYDPALGRAGPIHDMPVTGKDIDPVLVGEILREIAGIERPCAFIERQQAYPGQGVSTSFQTGRGFGIVLGAVGAMSWPCEVISAAKWKAGLKVTKDKDGARARASQLMPEMAGEWRLKKHHGRAEAALMAYYGALTLALPSAPHRPRGAPSLAARSTT